MADEQNFLQKAIDAVTQEYKKYIDYKIENEEEPLIEDGRGSFIPGGSFIAPFIPDPIKRAVYSKIKEEDTSEKYIDWLESEDDSYWDVAKKLPGRIDLGIQKGTTELGGALAKLPANAIDIVTEKLALEYGIGEATTYTDEISQAIPYIDTSSSVAEITSLLTQFGIPGVTGFKIANGLYKVKKLDDIKGKGGKLLELAKRGAVFGGVETVATGLAVDPERLPSITESLGIISPYDSSLTGADKAKDELKRRFVFGAEAGAITAAIPAFPQLAKYLYGKTGQLGATGFQYGQSALGTVVNPLSDFLTRNYKVGNKTFGIQKVAQQLGHLKVPKLPPFKKWRNFSTASGNKIQKALASIDTYLLAPFRAEGKLAPITYNLLRSNDSAITAEMKFFEQNLDEIGVQIDKIAAKFKDGYFKTQESTAIIANIERDILRFLKDEIPYSALTEEVRAPTVAMKKKLTELNKKYGNIILDEDLGQALIKDASTYLKQQYTAFNNAAFIPDATLYARAKESVKNLILKNPGFAESKRLVLEASGGAKATAKDPAFVKALDEEAEKLMSDILSAARGNFFGKTLTPDEIINRIARTLKINKPNLISNREIPEAVQEMLGKSNDLRSTVLDTAMQASKAKFNKRVGDALYKDGIEQGWLFTSREEARIKGNILGGEISKLAKDYTSLASKGKIFDEEVYAPKQIAQQIRETLNVMNRGGEDNFYKIMLESGYKQLMAAKGAGQYVKTILSPVTQIRNVTSGPMFILNSGLLGSKANIKDHVRIIMDDIFPKGTASQEYKDYIQDGIYHGVFDENVVTQEMKLIFDSAKSRKLSVDGFVRAMTESKLGEKATKLYQAGDNLWKSWAWKSYQDILTDVFNYKKVVKNGKIVDQSIDVKKVKKWFKDILDEDFVENSIRTGTKKSPTEILQEAAARYVTDAIPTYSKVGTFIKGVRKIPVIGNFIAFPAEVIRTSARNLVLGAKELASDSAVLRQNGLRRLFGTYMTNYGLYEGLSAGASALTGVSMEKIEAYRRSFAPSYQKNSQLLPFSGDIEGDGNFKIWDFSFYNPYSYGTSGVRAVLNSYADGKLNKETAGEIAMTAIFGNSITGQRGALFEYLNPYFGEALATERLGDVILRGGATREGKRIFAGTDNPMEKVERGIEHVLGAYTPGAFTSIKRTYDGVTQQFNEYGGGYTAEDELRKVVTGISVSKSNPLASMPFIITSFQKDNKALSSKYQKDMFNAKIPVQARANAYKKYLIDTFRSQKKLRTVYRDAEILGVDENDLDDIIVERLGSKGEDIVLGTMRPPNIAEERAESLKTTLERTSENIFGTDLNDIEIDKIDNAMEVMEQLKDTAEDFDLDLPLEEFIQELNEVLSDEKDVIRETDQPIYRKQSSKPDLGPGITENIQPSQQVVNVVNPLQGLLPTGLSRTETALLSPSEQAMRLKQRGIG